MYPILEINVPHTGDPEILRLNWPHLQGWEELTRPATSHQGPDRGLNLEVPFSINLTLKTQLKIQKNVHSNHQPGFICKNTEDDHVDFDWPNPTCAGALQRKQEMDVDRQAHLGPQSRRRRGQAGARTRTSAWRWVSSTSASPKPAPPGPGGKAQPTASAREELHIHRPASGCEVLVSVSLTPRGWESVPLGDPAVQHTDARGSKRARRKRRAGNCRGDAPRKPERPTG